MKGLVAKRSLYYLGVTVTVETDMSNFLIIKRQLMASVHLVIINHSNEKDVTGKLAMVVWILSGFDLMI